MKKAFSIISLLFFSFILFAEKPIVRDIQAEAGKGNKINIYWTLPENPEKGLPRVDGLYAIEEALYKTDKHIYDNTYSSTNYK